jgi:acetyltransferase-like isoleucine patch superfamily enzyme
MLYKLAYKIKNSVFILRNRIFTLYLKSIRGLKSESIIPYSTKLNWPHKIKIGSNSMLEHNVFIKHDGPFSEGISIHIGDNTFIGFGSELNITRQINIGNNCMIASGCKFIDHDHGKELGQNMNIQTGPEAPIVIEDDVWLGVNVVVLKGVKIEKGAIVAAGAIVNKSIPSNEIWGGIPARKIGSRYI